jgi:hypothetical protein
MPEADAFDTQTYDQYISAEVMVPKGDGLVTAKVSCRYWAHKPFTGHQSVQSPVPQWPHRRIFCQHYRRKHLQSSG